MNEMSFDSAKANKVFLSAFSDATGIKRIKSAELRLVDNGIITANVEFILSLDQVNVLLQSGQSKVVPV
jgi:hypothetical protein